MDIRLDITSGSPVRGLRTALLLLPLLASAVQAQQPALPGVAPIPGAPLPQMPVAPPAPREVPSLTATQAALLLRALEKAPDHGIADRGTSLPAADDTAGLVQAVMDYAQALHGGRLRADDFIEDWGLRPAAYDPWPGFVAAVQQDKLGSWLAALPPPYTGYDGLRKALASYRDIAAKGGWPTLAAAPEIGPKAGAARIRALRARLAVEDREVRTSGDAYDAQLVEAVRRAQRRYGLNPTGVAGAQTIAALNVPVEDRVRQIAANMERWRWLPQELEADRIQVNIAAAVLTVFSGDAPVKSMRAVTGRPGNETPMLSSQIHSIVVNPPWNVPMSIAKKELLPKGIGTLKAQGYKVIPLDGGGVRLQQPPGPRNSLGRLKFDFDNPYAVYLHDTPAQATFSRFDRLASHGCVRLEKPVELAELLLSADPATATASVEGEIAAGETKRLRLTRQPRVYLLYWTAFANANGQTSFRGDPYGWDKLLATKIEANVARSRLALGEEKKGS